jgi:5'-3' exonuclease
MVIACDSKNVWRREIFPNYKAGRKANREKSEHDWDSIFSMLHDIKNEIRTFLPYKVIEIETAEADDIIATLVKRNKRIVAPNHKRNVLILSGDKDFIQLHSPNVRQYNPVLNKFVGKGENPSLYIKEHILKGDRSDGVPNVLSDDNVFVESRRQRPLSKKKINSWVEEVFMTFTEEEQKNYDRNRKLIDLSCIPHELEEKINNEFLNVKVASRDKILGYFINKKLKTLIEVIDEF